MQIIVIAHNIRSTHNIGAILRTADGFGVKKVYCTGYTPYPEQTGDTRLPHIRQKITQQIHKTALGAEKSISCEHHEDVLNLISTLKTKKYKVIALEQNNKSVLLSDLHIPQKAVLLLGEEVNGVTNDLLKLCDIITEIPMYGKKESFNVSVATGIALYELTRPM